jgi:phage tail P2-like protein
MAIYYVTEAGAGFADGSLGNEWSLTYFNNIDSLTGGDTVIFSGEFHDTVYPSSNGNPGANIVLDMTAATLFGDSVNFFAIQFATDQAYITITGPTIDSSLGTNQGVAVVFSQSATYQSHDIVLDSFYHVGDETVGMLMGIYIVYVYNLTVTNWHFDNCNGLMVGHSGGNLNHDILVRNCYVRSSINTLYQTDLFQIGDAWNVTIEGCYLNNRAPADQFNPSDNRRHNDVIQFTSTGHGNPYNIVIRWNWIELGTNGGDGSSSWVILQAMNAGPLGEPALLMYSNVFVGTGTDGNQGINVGQGFENLGGNYYFINNTIIRHLTPTFFPIAFAGNAGTVGNTAPLGAHDSYTGIVATLITTTDPGNLLSVSFVTNDATGSAVMGFYADSSGVPGARIASSAALPLIGGDGTVNTFPISSKPLITPGNYWIAISTSDEVDNLFHYGDPTDSYYNDSYVYNGTLPATFPAAGHNNHDYSGWATFSVSPSTGNLDSRNNAGTADQPDFNATDGAFFVNNSMVPLATDYNFFTNVYGVTNADTGPHGSLTADLGFTDYAGNDFSFLETSPLRGAGDPSVALIDPAMAFGLAPGCTWPGPKLVPRSPYWSIGAYEVPPLLIPPAIVIPRKRAALVVKRPPTVTQYNTSFLQYLNPAARKDKFFAALAESLDPLLADYLNKIPVNIIISALSGQPEEVLDFLAIYHFNVLVYDHNFTYSQKLALVQNAIRDKINAGTPAAIKQVMSVAFNYCDLLEWWQEDPTGLTVRPNTFKVKINDPLVDPVKVEKMVRSILKLKNVRSYFAGIYSYLTLPPATLYVQGNVALYDYEVIEYTPHYL